MVFYVIYYYVTTIQNNIYTKQTNLCISTGISGVQLSHNTEQEVTGSDEFVWTKMSGSVTIRPWDSN